MEGSRLKQYIYGAACALLVASFWCIAPAAAATPNAFVVALASAGSATEAGSPQAGLDVTRVFDSSGGSDIVSFSDAGPGVSPVSGAIFGFSPTLPLRVHERSFSARFFEASSGASTASAPFTPGTGQAVGMQLGLPGGAQASIAMQSSNASFGIGPFAGSPSQEPAVFAFYNFPEVSAGRALGAFGPAASDTALASVLDRAAQAGPAAASSLSLPLINSLSTQGPFWYGSYSPATRGSSVTLTIPFQLARIPIKVRLGEQTVADVQSSSLAGQILGPAFATSAGAKYASVSGGVTVALPVLSRRATVSLDGWYETLQRGNQGPFNLAPYATAAGAHGAAAGPVIYTSATDLQQYVGAASVAVPLTSSLTVNGSFSEKVSGSVALDALTQSLTQHTTGYGGGVAYNIPKTNSSIEFFSNWNVFTDENVPNYNVTQRNQNLYFSVKF